MQRPMECPEQAIVVEGTEIANHNCPLRLASCQRTDHEYDQGPVTVRLEPNPTKGYALSVTSDGPILPEGFDPNVSEGLGMKIVRSYVGRISGELRFRPGDENQRPRHSTREGSWTLNHDRSLMCG